jgi:Dpy-30 motif
MTKIKPDDPLEWLANYMLRHNNNKPVIHATDPQTIRQLMDMREEEEREMNHKRIDDVVPSHCGCYLSNNSSYASSSTSTASCCCKKY